MKPWLLTLDQQREEHWAIVDLVGKGGHIRTVPVPDWVRTELDDWLAAAAIDRGRLFRRVNKVGRTWGDGMTVKAVWHIVKESARRPVLIIGGFVAGAGHRGAVGAGAVGRGP